MQVAVAATGGRNPPSGYGAHRGLRGLGGLSGLTEVGERPRLDRLFRHTHGNEPRSELLAPLGIVETTRR